VVAEEVEVGIGVAVVVAVGAVVEAQIVAALGTSKDRRRPSTREGYCRTIKLENHSVTRVDGHLNFISRPWYFLFNCWLVAFVGCGL
jgi:hypothetical protein